MPKTRRTSATPQHVQLPESIWVKISRLMSLKHWARVAGTCKMFSTFPRKNLYVTTALSLEGDLL